MVAGIAEGLEGWLGIPHETAGRHEPRLTARLPKHEPILVVGYLTQEDHRRDGTEHLAALGRELRVRRDHVDVEDSELGEPMGVEPARLVDIVPEDGVQAVQRLDIEVGVVAQLVREGIARPGQLRGRVEDHDTVLTHHVARDAQERLTVSKDVPSLGRHLDLDAGR